jgi:hypothetical protein
MYVLGLALNLLYIIIGLGLFGAWIWMKYKRTLPSGPYIPVTADQLEPRDDPFASEGDEDDPFASVTAPKIPKCPYGSSSGKEPEP